MPHPNYTQEELKEILRLHKLWINKKKGGKRADLARSYLANMNLSGQDLAGASLASANLSSANLDRADIREVNLSNASLIWESTLSGLFPGATLVAASLCNLEGITLGWRTFHADFHTAKITKTTLENATYE